MKENRHTKEDLKKMQAWSLERKIQITQTRIIEWYERFEGQVYVSFSGGKDSTVLLDLARRVYPDIQAVFVDTGLEYPEIRSFVKTFSNVTWLKPKMRFDEVIKKYGYPVINKNVSRIVCYAKKYIQQNRPNKEKMVDYQMIMGTKRDKSGDISDRYNQNRYKYLLDAPFNISNYCCDIMKKQPLRQIKQKPIIATMASESVNRKNGWTKTGCNSFNKGKEISKPMSFWEEEDVLRYLKGFNIPYCSVYGEIIEETTNYKRKENKLTGKLLLTGEQRTGCMFCPIGCHLEKGKTRFQRMKETHPKQYDYCINKLGLGKVLDYIGVKY